MLCKNPWMSGSQPCPCGGCTPCLVNKRRLNVSRMLLEQRVSGGSSFLTLTYDDKHWLELDNFSLDPRHYQLFLKRFRKAIAPKQIRYFAVGEYGGYLYDGEGERPVNPHFHFALFGIGCLGPITFPATGKRCFCSVCELIRSKWGKGNILLEPLNAESAQYISGYVLKKMTKLGDDRLQGRWPEFKRASNGGRTKKGGIGAPAMDRFWSALHDAFTGEIFLDGDVPNNYVLNGKSMPLGRYLKRRLRANYQEEEGTPQAQLQAQQKELWDMFLAAGGFEKFSSLKDYILKENAGKVALLEKRLEIYKKGKML